MQFIVSLYGLGGIDGRLTEEPINIVLGQPPCVWKFMVKGTKYGLLSLVLQAPADLLESEETSHMILPTTQEIFTKHWDVRNTLLSDQFQNLRRLTIILSSAIDRDVAQCL